MWEELLSKPVLPGHGGSRDCAGGWHESARDFAYEMALNKFKIGESDSDAL
jgi:hypothetical protein